MKILHYTLGFPPARSGGLVGYVIDLMEEQYKQGHEVSALYPGKQDIFKKKTYIKLVKSEPIKKYQIINSHPLAIFGGIKTPEDFMEKVSVNIYIQFLKQLKPQVIHVHTLMGIHKEFFQAAKELNIHLVYTSHDYFGLAPEPNFFSRGKTYDQENTVENWIVASENAMSTMQLRIFQSSFYPFIKRIIKMIRILPRSTKKQEENNSKPTLINKKSIEQYSRLKEYYQEIFVLINDFHFNSNISKEVYASNVQTSLSGEVISLSNSSVKETGIINKSINPRIRVAYIGPNKRFKGFNQFIELSKKLPLDQYEFHTYGYEATRKITNISQHGRYNPSDLTDIYRNIDILIVPSMWKETFGLIVLEALSNQTPVLVSDYVGAQDLIPNKYIFSSIENIIDIIGEGINENDFYFETKNMNLHTRDMLAFYNKNY